MFKITWLSGNQADVPSYNKGAGCAWCPADARIWVIGRMSGAAHTHVGFFTCCQMLASAVSVAAVVRTEIRPRDMNMRGPQCHSHPVAAQGRCSALRTTNVSFDALIDQHAASTMLGCRAPFGAKVLHGLLQQTPQ